MHVGMCRVLAPHVHGSVLHPISIMPILPRQEGAIERLIEEYLRGRFLFISANVVNHPALSYLHNRMGATLPFQPPVEGDNADWNLMPALNGLDDTPMGKAR